MNKLITLLSKSASFLLADGTSLVLGTVLVIVIGRFAGAEQLGAFSFASTVMLIGLTIVELGFDISLPRDIASAPLATLRHVTHALSTKVMIACVVAPIVCMLGITVSVETFVLSCIFALGYFPKIVQSTLYASMRGLEKFSQLVVADTLTTLLIYGSSIVLFLQSRNLILVVILLVLLDIVKSIIALHRVSALLKVSPLSLLRVDFSFSALASTFHSQLHIAFTNILSALMVRLPIVLLGWVGSLQSVGEFSAAHRIFVALRVLPGAMLQAVVPMYAKRESSPTIRFTLATSIVLASIPSALMFLFADTLVAYTFRIIEAKPAIHVLSLAFFFLFIKTIAEAILLARKQERLVTMVLSVSTIAGASLLLLTYYVNGFQTSSVLASWSVLASESIAMACFVVYFIAKKFRRDNS